MLLERCPWYVAGPLLGLVLVGFRAALNRPFGALGGFIDVVEKKPMWSRLGVSGFVLIGMILGGAIYAGVTGTFQPTLSYGATGGFLPMSPALMVAALLLAGIVMGFGARLAGGCTSGHGLTGMSLGSSASIAATMTFFATAVVLANVFTWLTGAAR
jgi:uncharacterized membrane protein YedE/YeeE